MVGDWGWVMVSTGMARKVDDLGRIVLPVEMRRMFGIQPGDELAIGVEGDSIILQKIEARCSFCNGGSELAPYRGKRVCRRCSRELAAGAAEGGFVDAALGDIQL